MALTADARPADLATNPVTADLAAAPFDVVALSGTIGAEVRGLDLRQPLDPATARALRQVWLERRVVFFRDQHLTPSEHVAFARQFGEVTESHPVIPGLSDQPEVFEIDYRHAAPQYGQEGQWSSTGRGLDWHTDVTFVARPPMASILNAIVIPAAGGDTLWSDQVAAFASLSPSLQGYLRTLEAVHDGGRQFAAVLQAREDGGRWDGEVLSRLSPVRHPVVRTHPETGEEVLFVNRGFTSHLAGLSAEESQALLDLLHAHSARPEHVVRWHWTAGDLAMWDNRATQHAVVGDFGDQARVIQRVTLRGDEPR